MPPRPRVIDFLPWPPGPTVDLTPIQRNSIAVTAFGRKHKLTDEVWEEVLDATSFFTMMDVSSKQALVTKVLPKLRNFRTAAKALRHSMSKREPASDATKSLRRLDTARKAATESIPTNLGDAIRSTYFENPSSPSPGNLSRFLFNLLDGLIPLTSLVEYNWKQNRGAEYLRAPCGTIG
jgi:hypothetical protein